ncbi:DUF169 domain-containing protein [Tissierella pigra]|uniref:DUF169 domain-containing protein n=1 Tax=Tissierella pigra TaxID=2607614 RepID=A0A6N7XGX8_9FIRM|nr:DUF169 domain-containing protein [Tissierella pigra]MBU5426839.1 DUF169 domain-containing protein [Tissierella pigra]MSU01289.1 hypothetical protein [Tissierella pigra]
MNIKHSVDLIESYLDLDRKPVGIKFFFDKDEFDNFEVPQRDRKVTYCNSVQLASKGNSMKLTKENQGCPNGAMALKMKEVPEPMASGKARFSKNIYHDVETSKSISDEMLFLKEEPAGIAVMPLENYKENPDVVVVVSSPYNVMRMIQGHGYFNGYTSNLRTVGLQAVCQDLTTYPYNTKDINITLLCPGTRLVADWQADEIGIGIPFEKWYEIVEGVKETANPFERDKKKEGIEKRLEERGLDTSGIKFNENYDDGSYTGGKIEINK